MAAIAMLASAAPTAVAAPAITPQAIEVRSGATTVVVTRDPLRIEVRRGPGRPVLSTVAADAAGPQPLLIASDPFPLGAVSPAPPPTRYAPIAITVGALARTTYPGGPWEANPLTGTAAGMRFAATRVTDARADGEAVDMTLATDDPSGRTVHARLAPAPDGGVRVALRAEPSDLVTSISASFASPEGERFRGFGGRHNALDQRGNALLGWVAQQNAGAGYAQPVAGALPGSGGETYLFPNGPTAAYSVSPSFVSSAGYGFLLERDELSSWRMASDRADAWQVEADGPALDARVIPGDERQAIGALTTVTGRQQVPPRWAVEPMLDRSTVAFTGNAQQYVASVRSDLQELKARDIPIGAYRIEGAGQLSKEDLASIVGALRARNIMPLVYFRAFVSDDSAGTDGADVYAEATDNGYVVKNELGQPYLFPGNFFGVSALLDFTNPATVTWWRARIRGALDAGAQGFMQDFGEQVLGDMVFADGRRGDVMHNRYPALYHAVTRRIVDEWEREHPDRGPVWFFTRAGYTGLDGSAGYENGNFAGDGNTDFSRSSGLASQAPDMLNRGISGQWGFTTDIGGYFDFVSPATTKELLLRWAQWAVFSPYFRLHGSINSGTHVPWNYDAETVDLYRALSRLRGRAAALIHERFRAAARSGLPVAEPLWLAGPDAPGAATEDQEWMVGPDLLVAPVVKAGATTREVTLPGGCWEHGTTGERIDGPARRTVAAPLSSLPWFVRCSTAPLEAAAARERGGCRDSTRPASRLGRVRVTRRTITVRGNATDRGCAGRGRVRRVAVAIALQAGARCRFLRPDGRLDRARACSRVAFLPARGTRSFTLSRTGLRLPPGRYVVWSRATDSSGNVERKGHGGARNFRRVRRA